MRELRIDSRQLAHARDEALEAIDVVSKETEQPLTLGGIFRRGEHFGGNADRRQRVLELVSDIAGKRLEQPDVIVEARGQACQRPGQVADLVAALDLQKLRRRRAPIESASAARRSRTQRPHDCRRQGEADDHGRRDRGDDNLEDAQAHVVERLENAKRRLRHDGGAEITSPRRIGTALYSVSDR